MRYECANSIKRTSALTVKTARRRAFIRPVTKTTNPDNYSIGFAYDAANRVIMAYDEEGHAVLKTLDLDGKPRAITDTNNITTQSEYYGPERDGRLKTQTDALGRNTTYDYDPNGNTVSVTDNLGRITLTSYDELNRPVRMVGPVYTDSSTLSLGAIRPVTRNTYDTLGNLAKVDAGRTDASGTNPAADVLVTQMSYAYDDFGRKLKETDALAKAWLFEYDLNSNIIKTTDPKGQIITATYAYGGVLTTRSGYKFLGDTAPHLTTYTRNNLGQIITAQSPAVTYTYIYNTAQRLQSVTDSRGTKTLTYTHSNGGRLKRLQDSEGKRSDYLYDPVGRLTGIWAANNDLITFLRDRGGRLTEKWFPGGANTRYTYNDDNTLQQIINRLSGSGSIISQNDYTYDGVGNRKTATEKAGSVTTPATSEAYGYDPLGNRSYKSDTSGATFYYSYDTANQLKDVRTGSASGPLTGALIYDANGNLIQKCEGGTVTATPTSCTGTVISTLTYDVYNRLVQVQKTGIATQTYQYDDQGRRISKTVGTATTNYLYNSDNIYAEYTSWSSPAAAYTHGPGTDDPLIRTTTTTNQYYHKDGLGSVVALTDTSGATLGTQLYDAWGNKLAVTSSGSLAQYGYTGREPDETGLIYYRARYYDPSIGRFTQRDPIGFKGGLNRYSYVFNNPTTNTDPDGTQVFVGGHVAAGFGGYLTAPFTDYAKPSYHAFLIIMPDHPDDFTNREGWKTLSNGQIYASIGGQPGGQGTAAPGENPSLLFGNLDIAYNYKGDDIFKAEFLTPVTTPQGISDTQFINNLIGASGRYQNDRAYTLLPDFGKAEYNSNSVPPGLILAAGGKPPSVNGGLGDGNFVLPGYFNPLPIPSGNGFLNWAPPSSTGPIFNFIGGSAYDAPSSQDWSTYLSDFSGYGM